MLAPKEVGGLGLGSIKALNLALLAKWKWRIFNERDSLWVKFINGMHSLGLIQPSRMSSRYLSGVWRNIDKCKNSLGKLNIADT